MEQLSQWLEANPLVTHDLIQGSDEWLAFRAEHDGSSEAAAMLGLSKKTSRNELLAIKATGVSKEFSDWVQKNVLDHGHEVEALARPIIERQLGVKLYPVTCSRGRISASCDGLTMAGTIGWEHKQWNVALASAVLAGELPEEYMPQVQQALMVTGAEKWIFTVSDGTEENMASMEVLPDHEWFDRLRAGWAQFHKDRAEYKPREIAERPQAEVSIELPALFVNATGQIIDSNMEEFGNALAAKLAEVRAIQLVTDQDFSNAKATAKMFREQRDKLELAKEAMLAQTMTIGEASRMIDEWREDLRVTALQLEKDVEKEDLAKKRAMVSAAESAMSSYIDALETGIKPIKLIMQRPNFPEAIKSKRTYTSMQDALDSALANGKVSADAVARHISANLAWFGEYAKGYEALFADLQQIIYKPEDDFDLLVQTRIEAQKKTDAAKLEAERKRIQAEEEAKAAEKLNAAQEAEKAQAASANDHATAHVEAVQEHPAEQPQEPAAAASNVIDLQTVVNENEAIIRAFLDAKVPDKDKNKVRGYLVEFVKFSAVSERKAAA